MGSGCSDYCKSEPQPHLPTSPVDKIKTPSAPRTPKPITPKSITRKPKTPSTHQGERNHRFNKLAINKNNPLLLIDGYLNESVVSLEEALKPFDDKIDQLSYYIQEAKANCHYPSTHGLTRNESAAIYIYTMKWYDKCLYDHLEEAWESNDPSKLKPWFKYLKLFKSAFDKLPGATTEIWQIVPYTAEKEQDLSSNPKELYSGMGTCLSSEKEMKQYIEKYGNKQRIIIGYESIDGKLISDYAAGYSNEVVIWPGMKLAVAKYGVNNDNGSLVFHLVGTPSKYHCGQASLFSVIKSCVLIY